MTTKKVISFTDLDVYQRLYRNAKIVHEKIIPNLPDNEKYGLKDQLSRSTKSPCALIAEGYARRQTSKQWKKYLRDAIGECNETVVHLSFARDLYHNCIDVALCDSLIEEYDISARQLFALGKSWK